MISRFWWNVLVLALCACGCASQQPTTITVKPTVARPPEIITIVPTPTYRPRIAVPEASDVEFSADRKWLAVGTMIRTQPLSGTISVRDCASNRVVKTWKFAGGVRFLAFAPDGRHIAAATGDNKIRVWDWRSGQLQHSSVIQGGEESQGRMPISYAPDGRTLAIGVKKIQLLDTQSWKIRQLSRQKAGDLIDFIGNLQFSPTGKWILTSDGFEGYSGYNLYRFSSGKARHIVDGGTFGVTVFSRDGRLFAGNAGEIQGEKTFIYNINESKIAAGLRRMSSQFGIFRRMLNFWPVLATIIRKAPSKFGTSRAANACNASSKPRVPSFGSTLKLCSRATKMACIV